MKRRFTSRPSPAASIVAAVVGVFMLIFALMFFSQAKAPPAMTGVFLVVWVVALIGIIIYHVLNATRPDGVPTQIIEGEDDDGDANPAPKSSGERLQELDDLHRRKLISDAEYAAKRQEILNEV
jgi:hypothetical protein